MFVPFKVINKTSRFSFRVLSITSECVIMTREKQLINVAIDQFTEEYEFSEFIRNEK